MGNWVFDAQEKHREIRFGHSPKRSVSHIALSGARPPYDAPRVKIRGISYGLVFARVKFVNIYKFLRLLPNSVIECDNRFVYATINKTLNVALS